MNKQSIAPHFWWALSENEMYQYKCLQLALTELISKNQRNKRINSFIREMDAIKAFAIRGDINDNLRSYVCGIIWLEDGIAVNIHYLRKLMGKCKSSINGSFQKLGFTVGSSRTEAANVISQIFPSLKEETSELRMWSIRKIGDKKDIIENKGQKSVINDTVKLTHGDIFSEDQWDSLDEFNNSFSFV